MRMRLTLVAYCAAALALALVLSAPAAAQNRPAQPSRPAAPVSSFETQFWNDIKDTNIPSDFRMYLDAYPAGQFAAQARERLKQLETAGRPGTPAAPTRPAASPSPPVAPPVPAPPVPAPAAPAAARIRDCPQCPELVLIPAGNFTMGSTELFPTEGPAHPVTIQKPFYLGPREVTFEEWDVCVAEGGCSYSPNDRGAGRGARPVTNVDWNDARQYLAWLSKKTGKAYRLPSESEWEYAARAGTTTSYPWGRAMEPNRANCNGCNSEPGSNTVATGSYPPNAFGLYDMMGNAAEWVEDCWNDSYRGAPADGTPWAKAQCPERVLRGGSFNNDPRYLRSASRFKYDFDVRFSSNGFRAARGN